MNSDLRIGDIVILNVDTTIWKDRTFNPKNVFGVVLKESRDVTASNNSSFLKVQWFKETNIFNTYIHSHSDLILITL